jgi:hypothetical protein
MIQSLVRCNLPDHLLFWHRIKGRPIDPIKLFTLFVFTGFPAQMLHGADSNSLTAERSPSHSTGGITAGVSGRFINTRGEQHPKQQSRIYARRAKGQRPAAAREVIQLPATGATGCLFRLLSSHMTPRANN